MRIALFSYEFDAASVFSGNGVLARSHARGLASHGHALLVVTAVPTPSDGGIQSSCAYDDVDTGARVVGVPVPAAAWRRLDSGSAHREYEAGAAAAAPTLHEFEPDVVLEVDWHGARAAAVAVPGCPRVYSNFRVHARTDGGATPFEAAAMASATRVTALCAADVADLIALVCGSEGASLPPVRALLPPLRADVASLPRPPTPPARRYLTCCVRLSREKEAHNFAALVAALAASGALARAGVTPALVGDGPDAEYAASVRAAVLHAAPHARIVASFLPPAELAAVFDETVLNVHPW